MRCVQGVQSTYTRFSHFIFLFQDLIKSVEKDSIYPAHPAQRSGRP